MKCLNTRCDRNSDCPNFISNFKIDLTFIGPESDQYLALLLRLDWCDLADDYACSILAVNFIDVVAHDIVDCLSQLICTHLDSHLLCSITKLKDHSHLEA